MADTLEKALGREDAIRERVRKFNEREHGVRPLAERLPVDQLLADIAVALGEAA